MFYNVYYYILPYIDFYSNRNVEYLLYIPKCFVIKTQVFHYFKDSINII